MREHHFDPETGGINGGKLMLFCTVCDKFVEEQTKHCGACDRCCYGFDHHCEWLNNCIGKTNYSAFRHLVAYYLAFLTASLLLILALFLGGVMSDKDLQSGRRRWYVVLVYVELALTVAPVVFMF